MIILHGDNQVVSRQQLTTVKIDAAKLGKQVVELEGDVSLDRLVSAVESNSLFGSTNFVVMENIFSGRPSNQRKSITDYLLKHTKDDIVVWEGKDVSTKIKEFDPQIVRKFDLPKYVFKFLDDFSLANLQLSLQNTAPEQILALLAGHINKLILVKEGVVNLPSWQLAKLKLQANKFSLSELITMNSELLIIDYNQKTSSSPYDLGTALEIFVVRLK